jgi:adenylate kinase
MIALIGMPGSGKSTQREILVDQLQCQWIYTGQLLRDNLTGEAKEDLRAGKVVDDKITLALLDEDLIRKDTAHQEVILDGSPRTIDQAAWLINKIKNGEVKLTALILLRISTEDAKQRLAGRARQDDNGSAINERFLAYQNNVEPMLDYLDKQGVMVKNVSALGTPQEVNQRLRKVLNLG